MCKARVAGVSTDDAAIAFDCTVATMQQHYLAFDKARVADEVFSRIQNGSARSGNSQAARESNATGEGPVDREPPSGEAVAVLAESTLTRFGNVCYDSSGVVSMSRHVVTTGKPMNSRKQRVLELVRRAGVLRPRDLDAGGIPREYLRRLLGEGLLDRTGRGIYVVAGSKPTPNHNLAEVCKRVPHGVVCLLSALQFHELTTQAPFEVWLAIGEKARLPKVDYPPMRVVRFSGQHWSSASKSIASKASW